MSEPSRKPSKKPKGKKPLTDLPDDEAILKLFPKKVVDEANRLVGHDPKASPSDHKKG